MRPWTVRLRPGPGDPALPRQGGRPRLAPSAPRTGLILALLGWWLLVGAAPLAYASDLEVRNATPFNENHFYLVDLDLRIDLAADPMAALKSGVPLTFIVDIAVERDRSWLPNKRLVHVAHRIRLERHALSNKYLLLGVPQSPGENFPTLEAALEFLAHLKGMPIVAEDRLPFRPGLQLGVRIHLDVEDLPAPLRLTAYIAPSWWLASGWKWTDFGTPAERAP